MFLETKIPFAYEDCIKILENINAVKNQRLAGKVALLKAIFWEYIGNFENQIVELQLVTNVFNYQYLVENTCSAFSNWLSVIQDDKYGVANFINVLHSFIAKKNFKDYFIENYLDWIIKSIFDKGLYDNVYSLTSFFSDEYLQNDSTTCFNCAYCFNHVGNKEKAKEFYTHYIDNHGNSGAVLNNLALIYESEGNTINAKVMFEKAVAIDPNNEKVISNLERITNHENEKIKEREENEKIQIQYKEASQRISFENDYVLEKLSNFIKNSSESSGFKNGKIALPEWRIPPFMQATKEKALSLKEQFIGKSIL
ncbi:MAG: hypothetical protein IPM81_02110 [Saprospirales bacterium]|nr:hypothetical protein [Saprospirales bacterium]